MRDTPVANSGTSVEETGSRTALWRASPVIRVIATAVALIALVVSLWPYLANDSGELNLHVHQASAFLNGRLDIPESGINVATFKDRHFVVFPPFPALILLPLVALVGIAKTKTMLVSLALTLLNIFTLRRVLADLGISKNHAAWILAAFFGGTAYWFCLTWSSGVWFYSQIVAVSCLLLALCEALGKGRGFPTGLLLGLAFLSRQLSIYGVVFLAVALWQNPRGARTRSRLANTLHFLLPIGLCVGAYLLLNWARFGNSFDTGYEYIALEGFLAERVQRYGLFHFAYVPFNFVHMFLQGFHVEFAPPLYLVPSGMNRFGTSLIYASPFLLIACFARWDRRLLIAAWTSIGLVVVHALSYYNNGWMQLNAQRFSLDFLPFAIVLVALGLEQADQKLWKATIAYSISLNVLALVVLPVIRRTLAVVMGGP